MQEEYDVPDRGSTLLWRALRTTGCTEYTNGGNDVKSDPGLRQGDLPLPLGSRPQVVISDFYFLHTSCLRYIMRMLDACLAPLGRIKSYQG